jgi:transposase
MGRKAKVPYEEKTNAVKAYLSGTTSIDQIAHKCQVSKMSVRMWITNHQSSGANGLITTSKNVSYPQVLKVKAVDDYIAGKGSQEAICRKYGIRSRTQLQAWIMKYNSHEELKTSGTGGRPLMTKGRATTFDERVEIVKHCIEHNNSYNETAEKFNISYQQARSWTVKYQVSGIDALQDRRGKRKSVDEMSEIEKLKAQNKLLEAQKLHLELENEFLKKIKELERGW